MPTSTATSASSSLAAGVKAPDFTLAVDGGGTVSLSSLKGKNVAIYFYPKDDTPGCTIEAKDFRDQMAEFTAANTTIIGISKDSVKSHEKFKEKYCLPFTLASDETGKTCEDYGVWVEKSMYGKKYMGIERTTFLVGPDGVIKRVWNKVKVDGHVAEVLAEARK